MDMEEIVRILASFEAQEVDYVIVGGVAVNLHGIVRATEDLDLFVRPTVENIERLRKALHDVYDDPCIDEINAEELIDEYPAVRYLPPDTDLYLDILTRLGEFAGYDDLKSEEIDAQGVKVKVAAPETLYWLKKDTVRFQDRADAEFLREKFHLEDHQES